MAYSRYRLYTKIDYVGVVDYTAHGYIPGLEHHDSRRWLRITADKLQQLLPLR